MFNVKKSKTMIFNSTNKYQFTIRLSLNNNNLDVVSDTKLLRTIIGDQSINIFPNQNRKIL